MHHPRGNQSVSKSDTLMWPEKSSNQSCDPRCQVFAKVETKVRLSQ
jgi:hypothetical protein